MTIRLNGSTSGYTEIDAPAVAGSNTLVLPTGNGTANQALVTDGNGVLSFSDRGRMVLSTSQSANNLAAVEFTSIPSWAKRITVMLAGISTNGTSNPIIQLGYVGAIETTGYLGSAGFFGASSGATAFTTGFGLSSGTGASSVFHSNAVIIHLGNNLWTFSVSGAYSSGAFAISGGGQKTLSTTLERVRITTVNGTDTFDAGTINILYEG